MFKRAASILVMIVMMFTMSCMVFVTTAEESLQFVLTPRATTCYAGGTCLIDVSVKNMPEEGISGIKFLLEYDKDVMELRYDEENDDLSGVTLGAAFTAESNALVEYNIKETNAEAVLICEPAVSTDKALITLKFDIKADVTADETTVKVSTEDATDGTEDAEGNPKQLTIAEGTTTVTIADFKWGDANGDGVTNIEDAILVLRRAVSLIGDDALNVAAADVDGTAGVSVTDAILILRHAVGLYNP